MNKILSVAVAAAMFAPLAAQADVKLSGTIQAEVGSVKFDDTAIAGGGRTTVTEDGTGALANGGPNRLGVDFDEKLNSGLTAFGRVDWAFNTAKNASASPFSSRETFVGLKGSMAHIRAGRIQGIYKTIEVIDPFYATSAQGRGTGGGMTGGAYGHSSYLDNVLELGLNGKVGAGKLNFTVQGIADEGLRGRNPATKDILAGLKYSTDNWGVFLSGVYHDFSTSTLDSNSNAKVGGWFKTGGLKLGLQYEFAEEGNMQQQDLSGIGGVRSCMAGNPTTRTGDFDTNGNALTCTGDYVFGSAAYTMGDVTLAATVGGYMSDDADQDAMSYSVGGMYNFSKRTFAYAAYHDTNSDDDRRDWDGFAAGIRHSF